jgi:hypothetical protein
MTKIIDSTIEALSDKALDDVTGGLNPQPLPPHELFSFARFIMPKINFASHFTLPALNVFRFF